MDHSGLKLHRDTSVQQSGTNFLLYAWTKPIRDFDAFLFTKSHSVLSINFVIVHPSRPLASKNVFVCHILFVIDHTHHGSKVKQTKISYKIVYFLGFFYRDSWPVTPYVKSIGYWALMCYCLVFYCILEYCVILSLKKTVSNIQTRNSMDLAEESNEEKRIRIVFNIEKISRICVPIYLLSFSVGYFIFMFHM